MRLNPIPMGTTTLQAAQGYFNRLRKATRLLIRHARSFRRLENGKALLRMFVKKTECGP